MKHVVCVLAQETVGESGEGGEDGEERCTAWSHKGAGQNRSVSFCA